jgi:hypothetical protein
MLWPSLEEKSNVFLLKGVAYPGALSRLAHNVGISGSTSSSVWKKRLMDLLTTLIFLGQTLLVSGRSEDARSPVNRAVY